MDFLMKKQKLPLLPSKKLNKLPANGVLKGDSTMKLMELLRDKIKNK